jgi:hypothetical protein
MKATRFILTAVMFLTTSGGVAAQSKPANIAPQNSAVAATRNENGDSPARQTPETVIREIYAIHAEDIKNGAEDRIVNGRDRRNLDKYFDKKLADLIWNDLTAERSEDDETGVIDFDLFYAAQEEDSPVANLRINPAHFADDKATVRAVFASGGANETVEYLLVEQTGAWKISDISYRGGKSLLKRFSDARW